MKNIVITIIGIITFIAFIYVVNIPKHCTGSYDRNDVELCEGDTLRNEGISDGVLHYGEFEGTQQWYTVDDTGEKFVLKDIGGAPKEQRSIIIK